jgi:hypothetical protein
MGAYFKSESHSFRNYLNPKTINQNNRILLSALGGTRADSTICSKKP